MSQDRLFVWKSHWKWLGRAQKLGSLVLESPGQGEWRLRYACQVCGGRAKQRNNGLCPHLCLGGSSLPALALMPDYSVSVRPSVLLTQHWSSEWVSPSKSMCGLLRGMPGTLEALCLTEPQSLLVFPARSYGGFSSWHWNLGLDAWCGAVAPCSSVGTSVDETPLPIFNCHICMWDQPILRLCPSFQSEVVSVYPSLQDFSSARLQVVFSGGCSVL